jgi:hypothetical protein
MTRKYITISEIEDITAPTYVKAKRTASALCLYYLHNDSTGNATVFSKV